MRVSDNWYERDLLNCRCRLECWQDVYMCAFWGLAVLFCHSECSAREITCMCMSFWVSHILLFKHVMPLQILECNGTVVLSCWWAFVSLYRFAGWTGKVTTSLWENYQKREAKGILLFFSILVVSCAVRFARGCWFSIIEIDDLWSRL